MCQDGTSHNCTNSIIIPFHFDLINYILFCFILFYYILIYNVVEKKRKWKKYQLILFITR